MSLFDFLSDEGKKEFIIDKIKIGSVIKIHVEFTNPPKSKRLVVIGKSADELLLGVICFNSENNQQVNRNSNYNNLQIPFNAAKHQDILKHDSYLDCARLYNILYDDTVKLLSDSFHDVLGEIPESEMNFVLAKLASSKTISPKEKKMFGLM